MAKLYKFYFIILCLFFYGCATKVAKIPESVIEERHIPTTLISEIKATDISFDVTTGEIRYTLLEPALVRIRLGIKEGGPLLRTLIDWEPRKEGENLEIWDRKDGSGLIDYSNRTDLLIVIACIPINQEDLVVYESTVRGYGKAPAFEIILPSSQETTKQGVPIISGIAPIRIILDKKDKKRLTQTKYEIAFFIDNLFLFEDEEGTSPFTYLFNTKGINAGEHTITVNLIGYEGEVGVKSLKVYLKKE